MKLVYMQRTIDMISEINPTIFNKVKPEEKKEYNKEHYYLCSIIE